MPLVRADLETVYEEALCIELGLRSVAFARQVAVELAYKRQRVGLGRLDLLIENSVVVELKAVDVLNDLHVAQALSYLKATGHHLALLINFNVTLLKDRGIRRVIW